MRRRAQADARCGERNQEKVGVSLNEGGNAPAESGRIADRRFIVAPLQSCRVDGSAVARSSWRCRSLRRRHTAGTTWVCSCVSPKWRTCPVQRSPAPGPRSVPSFRVMTDHSSVVAQNGDAAEHVIGLITLLNRCALRRIDLTVAYPIRHQQGPPGPWLMKLSEPQDEAAGMPPRSA